MFFEVFDEPIDALDVGSVGSFELDNVGAGKVVP